MDSWVVNPEIGKEIERWGRKEPRETGTETEQTCIASHRGPRARTQELWAGQGFPLGNDTGPRSEMERCLR